MFFHLQALFHNRSEMFNRSTQRAMSLSEDSTSDSGLHKTKSTGGDKLLKQVAHGWSIFGNRPIAIPLSATFRVNLMFRSHQSSSRPFVEASEESVEIKTLKLT